MFAFPMCCCCAQTLSLLWCCRQSGARQDYRLGRHVNKEQGGPHVTLGRHVNEVQGGPHVTLGRQVNRASLTSVTRLISRTVTTGHRRDVSYVRSRCHLILFFLVRCIFLSHVCYTKDATRVLGYPDIT